MQAIAPISPSREEIASFYDAFGKRLLRDYVYGNSRVALAVDRVCRSVRESHRTILDVGCGIGASVNAYKRNCPWLQIHGVDISPQNVQIANALFGSKHTTFGVSCMDSPPTAVKYDVVALIDVYEHIPRAEWSTFNSILGQCLNDAGVLVLTTPSRFHQDHLKTHAPDQLQVVDETVVLDDMLALAADVSGCLTCWEHVGVWNTHDYVHVVIEKCPLYTSIKHRRPQGKSLVRRVVQRFVDQERRMQNERRLHVKTVLGVDV